MALRRSKRSRLGLDSVAFETFGYPLESSNATKRRWVGNVVLVTEDFFAIPPDLPSLDPAELRALYQDQLRELATDRREPRIIELDVQRGRAVPSVRLLLRIPLEDRYGFVGSLTLPLAECSWVVKVQAHEGSVTGLREAVAFDRFARGHPDRSPADLAENFDPYEVRWDSDGNDPLTAVRTHLDRIEKTLTVQPEVAQQPPFRG